MIQISKIDEKLSIYKEGTVIIYGTGSAAKKMLRKLQFFDIDIGGFCDSDKNKWGSTFEGKKILSVYELEELNRKQDIVVQIGSAYEREIEEQLLSIGVKKYIYFTEAETRLTFLRAKQNMESPIDYSIKRDDLMDMQLKEWLYSYLETIICDEGVILCLPPKTGDHTIVNTLVRNNIDYLNIWHRPYIFDKTLLDELKIPKIKIVTAVRDPIAQNISWMFQIVENGVWYFDLEDYWSQGGDAQKLFDKTIIAEKYDAQSPNYSCIYDNIIEKGRYMGGFIQNFFESFSKSFLDITAYEFDKEKGYSIIKDGKLEIFVYQIEKLDSISNVLLEWLGCEVALLENGNVGNNKWYAESYRRAKTDLRFTREYFEKCYNEQYVAHFYSDSDIRKFKDKWKANIQ